MDLTDMDEELQKNKRDKIEQLKNRIRARSSAKNTGF